jgi:hypothetical protein
MNSRLTAATLALLTATAAAAHAQDLPLPEKPPAATSQPRERAQPVPLQVTVVLTRQQGDKKISSLPYVLGVAANSDRTTLRMSIQVPVPTTVVVPSQKEGGSVPQVSYQYRDVGTNIDCTARTLAEGLYQLTFVVEDSSLHLAADSRKESASAPSSAPGLTAMPSFRNFKSSFTVVLKDGQTTEYTSATDPVSGEVVKIDLTLKVLK